MSPTELLGLMRALELRLSTSEVNEFFRQQDEATRAQFVDLSLKISVVVSHLTTMDLNSIADTLDRNAAGLKAGIVSLQNSIVELDDAIGIVNTLSNVLGVVARVIAL